MTAFQRLEEPSHHNPEIGNVFIQQLYRDWYNVDANLLYRSLVTYQRIGMLNPRRLAVILRKFLYHLGS